MSTGALLTNEFVVLTLDALIHVTSAFVLGIVVIIACKLLSKDFVDAKLLTGLIISGLLVAMRVVLLNNVHHVLGGVDILTIMIAVGFVLFLTSLVLVYKLVAIPILGTILSSIVIVAAQLALAHYTPVLSLKLMPEGQRFAEYAGVSNEKTKQLMAQAISFQGDRRNNIGRVLKEALATLAFWSSEKEQETLSKDLSSGVRFIQERRAFMASMSKDELAEYRAAMSAFMKEQSVDLENRYSLEILKNATPEDLQNLASFMKVVNKEYGFTDGLPEGAETDDDMPPTLESLKQIAKNLKGIKIGGEGGEAFAGLLKDIMSDEDFEAEMNKVRGQIVDLEANPGQLMKTFQDADLEGIKHGQESAIDGSNQNPDVPFSFGKNTSGRGEKLFYQNDTEMRQSGILEFSDASSFSESAFAGVANETSSPPETAETNNRVDYYVPVNTFSDFPEQSPNTKNIELQRPTISDVEIETPKEDTSDYFTASALSNSLTEDYVLRVPKSADERSLWIKVANAVHIGAWFEGTGGTNKGTIFIDGFAYRSGEIIEREHEGERYLFRFEGVQEGQILITSLKRESIEAAKGADQSLDDS